MSNSIFDWPASLKRFVRFTSAKAEEVNDALDDLSAGLDTVEANIARAVKLPTGTADQTLALAAGQRAGLLLGFDPSGNIAGIAGGGRWRGDWAAATLYAIADYFRDPASKSIYVCLEQHTSASIATDLAANKVRLAIDVAEVENQRILAQQAAAAANGSYLLAAQKASDAAQSAVDATNNGAAQVALAANQVALAANQVSLATDQAVIAGNKAADADIARAAAVVAQNAAQDAFDSFDDRYLGAKASDPATDNDGNPLVVGALYFRIGVGMQVWNGSTWTAAYLTIEDVLARSGGKLTGAIDWATPVDVASAAATNIGATASNRVRVTGTTTITSLGAIAAGACRTVTFSGALTLTHNATSLILPGGTNITTAAGDVAEFESLGAGNWRCAGYMRANGQALVVPSQATPYADTATATTAVPYGRYRLTASLNLTLPASPADGVWVDVVNTSGTTTARILRNAQNINGLAEDLTIDANYAAFRLVYRTGYGWFTV